MNADRTDPGAAADSNIRRSLDLAKDMIMLANQGEADSTDDSCMALYGVLRDCAYKIQGAAERERRFHQSRGRWAE
jgi:hypothetical protein